MVLSTLLTFLSANVHLSPLSSKSRWDFTGKAKDMKLLPISGRNYFKKIWGPKCEQCDSYLFPLIMMGLYLLHGAVAISLSLTERGSLRHVHDRSFAFYSSKHLHIDPETKQQPECLTEYRFSKLPGNI